MKYVFKYRKVGSWFWKKRVIEAHIKEQAADDIVDASGKTILQRNLKYIDALLLKFEDGSMERIPEWSKYEMKLGIDWKLAQKKQMDDESGTDTKLNRTRSSKDR